jgi:hypothetical protein
MNLEDGSSPIITILLMLMIVSVGAFGFIIFVSKMNDQATLVNSDPTNLSGIDYNSDMYNATNSTAHGLAATIPTFVWIIVIFLAVVFLMLVMVGLKKH